MQISVIEVKTQKELRAFVHFPNELYRDNPCYVPQIESMERDTLTPSKNHAFEVCEGKYYLACDEAGKVVGRVAGIINHRYNEKAGEKICRFGWIDFIDERAVSQALMGAVEAYAREKGMEVVSGPNGFLEFDAAGILVEGFDRLPTAYGKYNAPYYEAHLLALGYRKEVDYVEYRIDPPDEMPERYASAAGFVAARYGLHQAPLRTHREIGDYTDGVFRCLNDAYSRLHGFSELTEGQCEDLKKQFLSHVSTDYLSIILDSDENVVAFGVATPSLSRALQKARGRLFPFGFLHILKALRSNDTLDLLLIAVASGYQSKGVNAMIFDKIYKGIKKNGIRYIESTRELEENSRVRNLWRDFGHTLHKRARLYRKEL